MQMFYTVKTMGTSNTPPRPPVGKRSNEDLLEDLDVSLRDAVHLCIAEARAERIALVKEIHQELKTGSIDLKEFFVSFNQATGWLMDRFLAECLEYPHVTPHVRLLNGLRRDFLCERCGQNERPEVGARAFGVCTFCLVQALEALRQKDGERFMVFRTYSPSKRCVHADSETVMVAALDEEWWYEPWCELCLTTEIQWRSDRE